MTHADPSSLSFSHYKNHVTASFHMIIHFTWYRVNLNLWSHYRCQLNGRRPCVIFPRSHRHSDPKHPSTTQPTQKYRAKRRCTKQFQSGELLLQLRGKDTEHCCLNNWFQQHFWYLSQCASVSGKCENWEYHENRDICIIIFALFFPQMSLMVENILTGLRGKKEKKNFSENTKRHNGICTAGYMQIVCKWTQMNSWSCYFTYL